MTSFNWTAGYPTVRMPIFGRNVVATSHALAAQAGLRMIWQGGNAVDAAIATAAAKTITEPCSNGLGSDAFCILWDGQRLHGLNASGGAPAAWNRDYFRAKYGSEAERPPCRGWDSVTVPGAVAAWVALSERFGRLPFADLLEPAIEIAERGYLAPIVVQQKWAAAARIDEITRKPGFAETFLPFGRAPHVGERVTLPGIAKALRAIGKTKGRAFYEGERRRSFAYPGTLKVGTVLPEDGVVYYDVPSEFALSGYNYTIVNDHPVLVDPRTRRVVEVISTRRA